MDDIMLNAMLIALVCVFGIVIMTLIGAFVLFFIPAFVLAIVIYIVYHTYQSILDKITESE